MCFASYSTDCKLRLYAVYSRSGYLRYDLKHLLSLKIKHAITNYMCVVKGKGLRMEFSCENNHSQR